MGAIGTQQAERVALQEVTARLKTTFPTVAPNTFEELVGTAYRDLSHARVRTYAQPRQRAQVHCGAENRLRAQELP
ncbi:three-helix bundle dimerization domain-containing protein [Streptomyces piniterrae]|uniref:three-helix bundle dimerization domain-containing protein n=1 Tax=Streptomyces piniterrae TaxID=2571125 RepID=UPI003CCC7545